MVMSTDPVEKAPWWKTAVFYQIYVRSFADSNGDGIGDLQGIIDKLDYLNDGTPNSLGVDCLWLTPFYESPNVDFGYDITNHCAVHPEHGSLADFDRLVDEAHRRGIRVIVDYVVTATSDRHPWFRESSASRDNPKRDWFIWRDGKNGKPPNNWIAVSGGPGWKFDPATNQYFYHPFFECQPSLNWRHPEARRAMLDVMRFWLDRRADGFRVDLLNHLVVDERLRDNPRSWKGWYAGRFQQPLCTRDQPESHEIVAAMRALLDEYGEKMMVGETSSFPWEPSQAHTFVNGRELNLAFNMEFFVYRFRAQAFREVVDRYERVASADGWPAWTLSNHDIPRHFGRYGGKYLIYGERAGAVARARVCAAMMLTLRGAPFLYFGEELGMTNRWLPRKWMLDPIGKKSWPFFSRDCWRQPMLWAPGPGAGFTTGTPWLPLDPDADRLNARTASAAPDSLLNFYRRLIWLRKEHPALQIGAYEPLHGLDPRLFAYRRRAAAQSIIVILNFADRAIAGPAGAGGKLLLSSEPWRKDVGGALTLAPYETLILAE
jgi:alpha-glucosidase